MTDVAGTIRVFAYGSNLCVARIAARVASLQVVAVGTIGGYTLRFNKKSRDGSAKANAQYSGAIDDVVWGVVYELDAGGKRQLDRFEGLGRDYFESEVEVETTDGNRVLAWLYCANPEHVEERISPYDWYLRFCLEGARDHGLPDEYVDRMARTPSIADPDRERHARESAVLA